MTRPVRLRVAGGRHVHNARISPSMGRGWFTTDCGKTKHESRFRTPDEDDPPVTCPRCTAATREDQ